MPKCSFCQTAIRKGEGKMFVQNTGRFLWFCSRKCEKNMVKLGRDSRNFKWASKKKEVKKKD